MPGISTYRRVAEATARITLPVLALLYIAAYIAVAALVENPIRHYNFCVFLSLSAIFFSWLMGGRRTMYYVVFFNLFFVVIFSKILWENNLIVYGRGLFFGKSFITMYVLAAGLLVLMLTKKSPADIRREAQQTTIEEAHRQRQNLEYLVASRKLRQDIIAQANRVKDELQLLEGAWKSQIHTIINDLPHVKERELHRKILLPFQETIIEHLRSLESGLSFDLQPVALYELYGDLYSCIRDTRKMGRFGQYIVMDGCGWEENPSQVLADRFKFREIVLNVLRNSQTALDLKRIELLREKNTAGFEPEVRMIFTCTGSYAELKIADNAGGVSPEQAAMLYREPVPSLKRAGTVQGQGTIFVKFFAEQMNMRVRAENTSILNASGLLVSLILPIHDTHQAE